MKLIAVYGAMPGLDHGLSRINEIIYKTFAELGETVHEVRLSMLELPVYDGIPSAGVEKIMDELTNADGVILSYATNLFAPCSVMQIFLEHLCDAKFKNCFADKNIFTVTSSPDYGESESAAYVSRIIGALGGFCAVTLALNARLAADADDAFRSSVEKYAEDYYRIVRQNRRFIVPGDALRAARGSSAKTRTDVYAEAAAAEIIPKVTAAELAKSIDMDSFTQRQERDIDEITQYFANKYKEDSQNEKAGPVIKERLTETPPVPRTKTCRQMTQNLPHYYQPQLAAGLSARVQFTIAGEENFDGYLTINNSECEYKDGIAENPDVSILCDSAVWQDVLRGKFTAQKAFMTGHLKVRGNFVLLTKFDQIFKLT